MSPLLKLWIFLALAPVCLGHWAYQGPHEETFPAGVHPIDHLLDQERARVGVNANSLAAPRDWLWRAAYSLTGLTPTAEQLRKIETGDPDLAYHKLLEEWLADPAYGERWARHWMDVARYADTRGYHFDRDHRYPYAYTYRDWLVRAFQNDLSFDEMIRWQIAGDHLAESENDPNLAALGFLTVGPRSGRVETIDDRVDVVTRGFLGTTVSCARCHDHKSDPIPTQDYYSFFSIFENLEEPENLPVIGKARDPQAVADFQAKVGEVEHQRTLMREAMRQELHAPESGGVYLELAWQADTENWDGKRASVVANQRGRYRPGLVLKWRDFLRARLAEGSEALQHWKSAMNDESKRAQVAQQFLADLKSAPEGSEWANMASHRECPLNLAAPEMARFFDTKDAQDDARHRSELARLETEHPGSPPRAMVVRDRAKWQAAQVYHRGDSSQRGEPFERQWLGFLGGGEFPEGKSPRLSLAEKIADPQNPLTARVIANRVWAWHFGRPLTEPSDFGVDIPEPKALRLLDHLALHLQKNDYSLKSLHRHILTSRAFRLAPSTQEANNRIDEENHFYWRWTPQRLDFESMRDRIHATAGSLDLAARGGPAIPIESERMSTRRTLYAFVDRYELASSLVTFDFPHPDLHASKRIETTVPQQALYLMNEPNVLRQATHLSQHPELLALSDPGEQVRWIYRRVLLREPQAGESKMTQTWLEEAAKLDFTGPISGHWEIRHASWTNGELGAEEKFPRFSEGVWKTGADLATAPLPWLHAGKTQAHPLQGHALILRWRASGKGEVRLRGNLKLPSRQANELAWQVRDSKGTILQEGTLPPGADRVVGTEIHSLAAGESLDFHLLAPHGHHSATTTWNFRVEGREDSEEKLRKLSDLRRDFPTRHQTFSGPAQGSALADLIQMLWASNDFQFIF